MNGSNIIEAVNAFPPKPSGIDVLTSTGIVWYTINVVKPRIMKVITVEKIVLFVIRFKSINGIEDSFQI